MRSCDGGRAMAQRSSTTGDCARSEWNKLLSLLRSVTTLLCTPPVQPLHWVPDAEMLCCFSCHKDFSALRRRHHCRCCGCLFCGDCSEGNGALPYWGLVAPDSRVCDQCHAFNDAPLLMLLAGDLWRPRRGLGCGGARPVQRAARFAYLSADLGSLRLGDMTAHGPPRASWESTSRSAGSQTRAPLSIPRTAPCSRSLCSVSDITKVEATTSPLPALVIWLRSHPDPLVLCHRDEACAHAWADALQRLTTIQAQRARAALLVGAGAGAGADGKVRVGSALRSANDKHTARLRDARWHELTRSLPAAEIDDVLADDAQLPAAHQPAVGPVERRAVQGSPPRKLRHAYSARERPRMVAVGRLTQACS